MNYNVYGKRGSVEIVNLRKVVIGIGVKDKQESWVVLEPGCDGWFADVESLSAYKTEKGINVLKVKESTIHRFVEKRTAIRELDYIFGIKELHELFKKTKSFFDNIEVCEYTEELLRIKEILNKYEPLFIDAANGKDVHLSIGNLTSIIKVLKRMYTYAFGSPMNENTKIKVKSTNLTDPNETLDIENLYISLAIVRKPKMYKRIMYYDCKVMVFELLPQKLEEENLNVIKDVKKQEYYYLKEDGTVVKPDKQLPGIKPATNIGRFSKPVGILELLNAEYSKRKSFTKQKNEMIDYFANMSFNSIKVRDIKNKEDFLSELYLYLTKTWVPRKKHKSQIVEDFKELDTLLTTIEVFSSNKTKRYSIY